MTNNLSSTVPYSSIRKFCPEVQTAIKEIENLFTIRHLIRRICIRGKLVLHNKDIIQFILYNTS